MNATLKKPDQAFFAKAAQAPQRLLLLDYDGTLSPFVTDRFQAYPYPGVPELLSQIIARPHSRLVIITGRPLVEIKPLLRISPLPEIWGSHGWEHLRADNTLDNYLPPEPVRQAMKVAEVRIRQKVPPEQLDLKPGSLAVHWRGLVPEMQKSIRANARYAWQPFHGQAGLTLNSFDGGYELRAPGRDKGTATRILLEESGGRAAVAYLGDDLTDEDAFAALGDQGEGILVRQEFRETQAKWWIKPPEELLEFLEKWLEACK